MSFFMIGAIVLLLLEERALTSAKRRRASEPGSASSLDPGASASKAEDDAPAETMSEAAMARSVARALQGQTPASLLALWYSIDERQKYVSLRAQFSQSPTENDRENVMDAEGEINGDFPFEFMVDTEFVVVDPSIPMQPLSGGFYYVTPDPP